jgi:hypothetical protein
LKHNLRRLWKEETVKRVKGNPEDGSVKVDLWSRPTIERNGSNVFSKADMC